ncbi:MAG: tRNA preQ1(34) S-adenosylmethionine ribosyltransferase-isomerase QueA [Alphaproteobacteria bacterium]|jgi:S-adenosylmethionine:tRNA ribosyltransferase-isomerase|nr:tRNA preQ1(34) S-adenosylmethionine ribosyltransferase-isomerase QueA [Alphaproteobacteria bacterium]
MKLSDFDFDLPEALIATRPARPRSSAKLLVAQGDAIADRHVRDLTEILQAGDLLVLNTTKVIPARLSGHRHRDSAQGSVVARVEITLTEPQPDGSWRALAKPLRKLAEGEEIVFAAGLAATVVERGAEDVRLAFNLTGPAFDTALEQAGQMPLPPYIEARRKADDQDRADYQTVFARDAGAVAAPTASLHFDADLLDQLRRNGVEFAEVTLHVGAGTFLPVKTDDVTDHKMHAEWGQVDEAAAARITRARAEGRRVIPVGTTALRVLETAATGPGRIAPYTGMTDIFITPGFRFQIASGLMTNFHLPKSTLMMLVSALMGRDRIMAIYAHAIAEKYRFFSYGDSSLLLP